jgi:hypothetical protein
MAAFDPVRSTSVCKNGFDAISSVRRHAIVSIGGACGGRSSSSSSTALSASAQ